MKFIKKIGGLIGVWLCDHCYPRPCTFTERGSTLQYTNLMIDVLKGNCSYYGRDKEDTKQ